MEKYKEKEQTVVFSSGRKEHFVYSKLFAMVFKSVWVYSLAALLFVLIMVCGCGYSTKSLIIRDVETIYVPVFENNTFRRDLEFDLTKAVKDEVLSKTSLRIVKKDDADTVLYGTINNLNEAILTQNTGDNIVENQITLFVDFKLIDMRTGKTLVERKDISQLAEYVIARGETLDSAYEEGVTDMAETIVNLIEEKW
ncbi:MAG: LPS assembly lipoprotein LptE [Candidatus Scalindua sp.]|nr:LPS assembly lipoprotein LptE [Candidatus Scalindua sp.]